jgi:hypothetical protein
MNYDGLGWGIGAVGLVIGLAGLIYAIYIERRAWRILKFSSGPQDWQALLADPVRHWRSGYSARTLAYSWESRRKSACRLVTPLSLVWQI